MAESGFFGVAFGAVFDGLSRRDLKATQGMSQLRNGAKGLADVRLSC
jgi:hypothetical protein